MKGWIVLFFLLSVPFTLGYFFGHCKGYNQFIKDLEDENEEEEK